MPGTQDTVALSSESLERGAIIEQIKALPDVPTKELSAIRAAIENGTYRVSSEQVAGSVFKETLLDSLV
jgi:flagellar biosynthesis anti-sigma factor FlgM